MIKANKIKIESEIPIPSAHAGKSLYPFDKMKVGDSFEAGEYSKTKMQSLSGSIQHYVKKDGNGKKFITRKTDDGRLRVWRIA